MFEAYFLGALPTVFAMETIYGWGDEHEFQVKMKSIYGETVHCQRSKKPVYVFAMQWTVTLALGRLFLDIYGIAFLN